MIMSSKVSPILLASLLIVGGCGSASPRTQATTTLAGCQPYEGAITEVKEFTPYEAQRSHLPDAQLNPKGAEPPEVPDAYAADTVAGNPRQWAVVAADGAVYQYFSDEPVTAETTVWGFQRGGGIQLEATPLVDGALTVDDLAKQIGDRGVRVDVGDSSGLVVWADPESPSEQRLHHVYWDDGGTSFALIGDLSASDAVTAARAYSCRGQ